MLNFTSTEDLDIQSEEATCLKIWLWRRLETMKNFEFDTYCREWVLSKSVQLRPARESEHFRTSLISHLIQTGNCGKPETEHSGLYERERKWVRERESSKEWKKRLETVDQQEIERIIQQSQVSETDTSKEWNILHTIRTKTETLLGVED